MLCTYVRVLCAQGVRVSGASVQLCLWPSSAVYNINGKFTKENTVILDDNPIKHILNDSKNVLLLVSWSHKQAGPSDTFLMDTLLP